MLALAPCFYALVVLLTLTCLISFRRAILTFPHVHFVLTSDNIRNKWGETLYFGCVLSEIPAEHPQPPLPRSSLSTSQQQYTLSLLTELALTALERAAPPPQWEFLVLDRRLESGKVRAGCEPSQRCSAARYDNDDCMWVGKKLQHATSESAVANITTRLEKAEKRRTCGMFGQKWV